MANEEKFEPTGEPAPGGNDSSPPTPNVGYRRPPHHSQFKKGQSGNPKGRPKGSKNMATYFDKELNEKIMVVENGVRKRIPKKHAIAKRIVSKAAAGDPKMVSLLLNEERSTIHQAGVAPAETPITEEDERVFESLIRRIRESEPPPSEHLTPRETTPGAAKLGADADHGDDDQGDPGGDP